MTSISTDKAIELEWCIIHNRPKVDGWSVCEKSMWTGAKSTCDIRTHFVIPDDPTDKVIVHRDMLIWVLGRTDVDPRASFYKESRIKDGEKRLKQLLRD